MIYFPLLFFSSSPPFSFFFFFFFLNSSSRERIVVKARAGWMGMGRGAGSTALGLFQILPVFLCIFPSGKEQPLYFKDFFSLYFSQPLDSRLSPPCLWASFSLPLLAAVCHMFEISKWGSVLVRVFPSFPLPPSSCGGCFSLTSSSLSSRCLIPQGRRWSKSKQFPAKAAGGCF